MVKHPWEYEYSSTLKRLHLLKDDPLLSTCKSIEDIVNYKEFLQETRTGKPCGDENFYDKIKAITGINYTNKKTGPKSKNGNS